MRPIDADKLKCYIHEAIVSTKVLLSAVLDEDAVAEIANFYTGLNNLIDSMPTIDAEPVRHGRWKEYDDDYGDTYECTSCGELFCMIEGTPIENGYDYCPKCGAKMDERKEE